MLMLVMFHLLGMIMSVPPTETDRAVVEVVAGSDTSDTEYQAMVDTSYGLRILRWKPP